MCILSYIYIYIIYLCNIYLYHTCIRSKASAGPVKEPEFIPSPEFTGSILGMVYKHDTKGLGYYKDASYKHKGSLTCTKILVFPIQ